MARIFEFAQTYWRIGKYDYLEKIQLDSKNNLAKKQTRDNPSKIVYSKRNPNGKLEATLSSYQLTEKEIFLKRFISWRRENGLKFPRLWKKIEADLKENGIKIIKARLYPEKIVSLMERMGFRITKKEKFLGFLPIYIYRAEKEI